MTVQWLASQSGEGAAPEHALEGPVDEIVRTEQQRLRRAFSVAAPVATIVIGAARIRSREHVKCSLLAGRHGLVPEKQ